MNSSLTWTDEKVNKLKTLVDGGLLTAASMGAMLGVSRNAVIGKVNRMGWKLIHSAGYSTGRPDMLKSVKEPTKPKRGPDIQLKLSAATKEKAPIPAKNLSGAPITPLNVTQTGCRWPYGMLEEGTFHYCGHPGHSPGRPWCEFHHKIVHIPPQPRKYS